MFRVLFDHDECVSNDPLRALCAAAASKDEKDRTEVTRGQHLLLTNWGKKNDWGWFGSYGIVAKWKMKIKLLEGFKPLKFYGFFCFKFLCHFIYFSKAKTDLHFISTKYIQVQSWKVQRTTHVIASSIFSIFGAQNGFVHSPNIVFNQTLETSQKPNELNSKSLIHVFRFCFFSFRSLHSIHFIAKFDNRDRTILIQLKNKHNQL